MIGIVKCDGKREKWIQLPGIVTCKKGDTFQCPISCPNKSGFCSKKTSFSVQYILLLEEDDASKKTSVKYTDDEIESIFGIEQSKGASSVAANHDVSQDIAQPNASGENRTAASGSQNRLTSGLRIGASRNQQVAGQDIAQPNASGENRTAASGSQNRLTSGSRIGASREEQSAVSQEQNDFLRPQNTYNLFNINGKVFSNDQNIRERMCAKPLNRAIKEIFAYWETRSVFEIYGNEVRLRDDFVWLLVTATKINYRTREIEEILSNSAYNVSQKFFYLFYDIIYRHNPPEGFYWCDERLSFNSLIAYFKDKNDFYRRYSRDNEFREFYRLHKREILHFLQCDDEQKLFENMTLFLAMEDGELVLIDEYNDYQPTSIGSIETFIQNMQRVSDVQNMKDMVKFLKRYRVTRYGCELRPNDEPFVDSEKDASCFEDDSMYKLLGLSASAEHATEYNHYVSLLREYVMVFNPREIRIGTLYFSRRNISNEFEEIVKDFCRLSFRHVNSVDENAFKQCSDRAWLAKSIYERGIITRTQFAQNTVLDYRFILENKSRIDGLMKLVSRNLPTIEEYLSMFENPVIRIDSKDLTIPQYISELMQEDDVYTICGKFRSDDIVRKYLEFKESSNRGKWESSLSELDRALKIYQDQFDAFMRS